jgi:hypothetical protein
LCSRLAALWQQHTGQKLKAGEFEPLLGVLCDTAERQRIGPGALFVRSAKVFAADCESKSKRPVLRWLIDQFGEWAAPPEHASGEQPKHATMSPLTAEQERDRQAFLRGQ